MPRSNLRRILPFLGLALLMSGCAIHGYPAGYYQEQVYPNYVPPYQPPVYVPYTYLAPRPRPYYQYRHRHPAYFGHGPVQPGPQPVPGHWRPMPVRPMPAPPISLGQIAQPFPR